MTIRSYTPAGVPQDTEVRRSLKELADENDRLKWIAKRLEHEVDELRRAGSTERAQTMPEPMLGTVS